MYPNDILLIDQEHPEMTKTEKKKLCRLMDCKKLSMDACMHAAQNDRLPLRVVVQVLFFEQVRSAMTGRRLNLMNGQQQQQLLGNNGMSLMPLPRLMHCNHDDAELEADERSSEPSETSFEKNQPKGFSKMGDVNLIEKSVTRLEVRTRNQAHMHMHLASGPRTKQLFSYPKKVLKKLWTSMN